jgi:membrane fusion protein, multidrug efflux system
VVDIPPDATIVPTAGVQIGTPGTFVYFANPDATVSVRPVKLGPSDGQRVTVLEGLAPGDKVVVDGVDRLRDGAKIRVPEAASPNSDKTEKAGRSGDASRQHGQK